MYTIFIENPIAFINCQIKLDEEQWEKSCRDRMIYHEGLQCHSLTEKMDGMLCVGKVFNGGHIAFS